MTARSMLAATALAAIAAAPATAGQAALERLHATVQAAWQQAPELAARQASLEAAAAGHRADAAPGGPTAELQREGIGPSFTSRANAQTSFRLATPFTPPWEWHAVAAVGDDAGALVDTGVTAARLDVAARAADAWITLAGSLDELAVATGRLGRLEQALELQSHRLELGEVAGIEVVQLELERLRDAGRVHQLETAVAAARAHLTELAGPAALEPEPGDLAALAGLPATLPAAGDLPESVARGPLGRAATAEARVQGSRAALVARAAWGRPEAEAEWESFPAIDGMPGYDALGLRVSWPLPLGRAGRQRAAAARAEAAAAEAAAEASLRQLERRARAATAAADNASRILAEAEPTMERLASAEHSLAEQFRLGAISYLVYIDGLSRLDEVRTQAITARRELLAARLELARVLGDSSIFPLPEVEP